MMGTKNFDNALDLITFSRTSGGTALRKISYGPELVTNGTFDADVSGWGDVGVWDTGSISWNADGYADVTVVGFEGTAQVISGLTIGATYSISVEVIDAPTDTGRLYVGSASNPGTLTVLNQNNLGVGTYVFYFTANATSHAIGLSSTAGNATVGYDNISVKEVLFDRPDGTLTLFNHPAEIPRIDYAADGTVKGLLVEEARTNLVTYSEDFAQWTQTLNIALDTDGTFAPDGSLATRVTDDAVNGIHRIFQLNVSSVADNTFSVFMKAGTLQFVQLLMFDGINSHIYYANFDIINQTLTKKDAPATGTITADVVPMGNGWARYIVSGSGANVANVQIVCLQTGTSGATPSYVGSGDTFYVYGAQAEQGAFPTSYIPTSGATATRAADIASIPVSAFGYNQKAGSVVVEWQTVGGLADSTAQYLLGTNSSSARWAYHNSTGVMQTWDGSNARNIVTSAADLTSYTSGISTDQSLITTATNGAGVIIDAVTNGNLASLTSEFRIGADHISANQLNGHIRSIAYYPRRLSNAQLQELTS